MKNDRFAEIAAGYKPASERGLLPIEPPVLPDRVIGLREGDAHAFSVPDKITAPEELKRALADMRRKYAPFLENHAPAPETGVETTELTDFTWQLDGKGEIANVTLPHYGGPVGQHYADYRTVFPFSGAGDKSVFLCFDGVDYIAEVFLNGSFIGRHEGFFAPFEFEITDCVVTGDNVLQVRVRNDYVMMASYGSNGEELTGGKVYAATGIGWDDPAVGWHHCPPGMGIYQRVTVQKRPPCHITDIFPRFNSHASEIWVECSGKGTQTRDVEFEVSVFGKNFSEKAVDALRLIPTTRVATGIGDTLTEAAYLAEGILGNSLRLHLGDGYNRFILPVPLPDARVWTPETPWLYEVQVTMLVDGQAVSRMARTFGVRDFVQEPDSEPKGRFRLNGREIRLRGANTMGFEQLDVMRKDWEQLIDDILLAKLCNMNYLRITQRPVQHEVYEYCDMLGLMVQTDMPLFGTIRINQYCEVLRQTEEMERLIRSHPSCVIASYINEPFPNSENLPHRMITREAMTALFDAADDIVHLQNPDRVTKHVDGDYDPPSRLMPDNHCYTMWYNGHGMDLGKLHKGYWLDVKPGWYCGCGEFGSEALDPEETMDLMYPKEWLTEPFDPARIVRAQTGPFHYFFYETPKTRAGWVAESQRHQAFATKLMTSAFRRSAMINSFAIHLFIDAWPSGWMKSIMDCRRNPKPAYFAYMDCLSPVFCSLRGDRFSFFGGETFRAEAWLVSDEGPMDTIAFQAEADGRVLYSAELPAAPEMFQGFVSFPLPAAETRTQVTVTMCAKQGGEIRHWTAETYSLWPAERRSPLRQLPYAEDDADRDAFEARAAAGETVVLAPLAPGKYTIAGHAVTVTACGMSPLYCVSRDTGHRFVRGLEANDLAYLYDSALDRLSPVIEATFEGEGVIPAVLSGNQDENGDWHEVLAMGEIPCGRGSLVVNQLLLDNKYDNPAVVRLVNNLTGADPK